MSFKAARKNPVPCSLPKAIPGKAEDPSNASRGASIDPLPLRERLPVKAAAMSANVVLAHVGKIVVLVTTGFPAGRV